MLVLTRKIGERIVVSLSGEIVTIEILQIAGCRVRVGIDAPAQVRVLRAELRDKLAAENGLTAACTH